jgi:uncharacterized protein (DUF934 family)
VPLLDRNGLKADPFVRGVEGAAAPILPLDEIQGALDGSVGRDRIGVDLPNHVHPERLRPFQDRLDLVAIDFPRFSDGRGFSLARMLREQGFGGTLRATGRILPDQFAFALQCGFDEIELTEEQAARLPVGQWLDKPAAFSGGYQDSEDGRVAIFRRRRAAAAEAA